MASASAGFRCIVSIHKRSALEPRAVIYALLAARISARQVTVVDDDINVFDPYQVEWATATRVLPQKDSIIPPVSRGFGESSIAEQLSGRWAIDATMPLKNKRWYKRVSVPGVDKVDYI